MAGRKQNPVHIKTCESCGRTFDRKRFTDRRLEDYTAFIARRYCSRSCANKGRAQ